MRIAIFSDVHGNLTALEAVLEDIKKQRPDLVLFAGDLCVFGARPAACLQRLRSENIGCIYGNTDQWLSNEPLLSRDIEAEEKVRGRDIDTASEWTWAQLDEMERAWLRTLPSHRRVSPTVNPRDDLFVVHANPKDAVQSIHPAVWLQEELYGKVRQTDSELRPLIGQLVVGVLCFGHVHIPNVRRWSNMILANISSVSMPLDGDDRAKYGLLSWNDGWTIEHRRVTYNLNKEINYLARIKPPKWEEYSRQLQTGYPA